MKHVITVLIALVAGFAGAAAFSFSGLGNPQTREYLLENPEILPELASAWQQRDAQDRLTSISANVTRPFDGAVLGNPNGSKTLVKFTDYACGYCRATVADIDRLIAEDPELRVVVREWPIFDGSEAPARMSLAAAAQGKYDAFYHAMFALGSPTAENIAAAARTAGLDMEAARLFGSSDDVTAELARNGEFARQLQFTGTPSWVYGDRVFEGAVGYEQMRKIIAETEG
ncbi:DsbA family protein [Erythrobacter sp. SD-21]|uniref:DsbA family protein n=1 Tax=Erythrobacter sp. SD-21 TaxID=161528 RepID=UPI000153FD06|nr:DsbA family protein [Erythrobacter sp. SD-21]EDL49733.1 27kDa outer membrane protein [Erythrobacter sp. SD-21]